MNSCEEYQELISQAIDGEISEFDLARLRAHLAQCEECSMVYDAFLAVSAETDYLAEPPETLAVDVMDTIRTESAPKKGKKRRVWASVAAIAACLVLVTVAVSGGRNAASSSTEAAASAADYSAVAQEAEDFAPESAEAAEDTESDGTAEFSKPESDATGAVSMSDSADFVAEEDMIAEEAGIAVLMDMTEAEIFSGEADGGEPEATITDSETLSELADILDLTPAEDGAEPEGEPMFTIRLTDSAGAENELSLWLYEGHLLVRLSGDDTRYMTRGTLSEMIEFIAGA